MYSLFSWLAMVLQQWLCLPAVLYRAHAGLPVAVQNSEKLVPAPGVAEKAVHAVW